MIQTVKHFLKIRLGSIFLVVLLIISGHGIAQGEMNNWFFGKQVGLSFSSSNPKFIRNSRMNSIEACASISDSSGKLLFYCQPSVVYNRNHEVMKNGSIFSYGENATQGTGILPMPGSKDKYYVFSMQFWNSDHCSLEYSIVDMSLDNDLGEVVEKYHMLRDSLSEKLTFVQQPDSPNIWVIVQDSKSDKYSVFLLSDTGFSKASTYSTGINKVGRYGYLVPSPDGTILASAVKQDGFIEVCSFDPTEGIISESFKLEIPNVPYGVCFSPDNSKLYATAGPPNHVYQFDLALESLALIQASRVQISSIPFVDYGDGTGALKLAPNGKIYLAIPESNSLSEISQPNETGISCGYVENSVLLGGGSSQHGLPNSGNLFLDQTPANILNWEKLKNSNQQLGCGDIVVTPNPTKGIISVKSFGNEISSIMVYDLTGRLVMSKDVFNNIETQLYEMQFLATGTYIVRVSYGKCVNEKKVIIMH